MGRMIRYEMELVIKPRNFKRALEILNNMFSEETMSKYFEKKTYYTLVNQTYSFVNNYSEYETIEEGFRAWHILNGDAEYYINEMNELVISGKYNNKWGSQEELLNELSEVIEDTIIYVKDEYGDMWIWRIKDYKYERIDITEIYGVKRVEPIEKEELDEETRKICLQET